MPIRIGATGLVGALVFHGATALAANPPPPRVSARLDYRAPAGTCPPAAVLQAEVARHLGYDPFTAAATTRIVAGIGVEGRGLTARLEAFDGAGRAEWSKPLQAADGACAALLSRMGNAIAFYLDPLIFSGAASERGPAEAPRPESPKRPEREVPKPKPLHDVELGLSPLLTLGAPEAAFGLLGHAGVRWRMLSAGLELRYDPPRSAQVAAPHQSLRMGAGALGGSFVPCVHVSAFFGCVVFSAGRITLTNPSVERPQGASHTYLGAGPRVGVEKRFLPWLGVRLHGEMLVMQSPWKVTTDAIVFEVPSPLAARVNGAVGVSLMTYFSP